MTVVKVDGIVVNEGVDGGGGAADPMFAMELHITLSLGVDGRVSSSWKARSNARSRRRNNSE